MCNVTIAWFLGANTIFVIYVNHSKQLKIDQILGSRNVMKRHQVEEEAVWISPGSNVTLSACFEQ